jgi:predicted RNA-binding protein with PIN domain
MKPILIVDGYNVIFAWKSLKQLADESLEHARDKLIDTLAGYGKLKGFMVILVFDAMYTEETEKSQQVGRDCQIIFTDKEETADSRIEKMVYEHRNERRQIYVATSDGPEQNQILGAGAFRIPARELEEDVALAKKEHYHYDRHNVLIGVRNEMRGHVKDDVLEKLERMRRKK